MNDADINLLRFLLQSCADGDVGFRVLKADMLWDKKDPIRPLWFHDRETGAARDNMAACENSQHLFNFKPGFDGKKKRTIIIIDA